MCKQDSGWWRQDTVCDKRLGRVRGAGMRTVLQARDQ